jgi:hypothetical protein
MEGQAAFPLQGLRTKSVSRHLVIVVGTHSQRSEP